MRKAIFILLLLGSFSCNNEIEEVENIDTIFLNRILVQYDSIVLTKRTDQMGRIRFKDFNPIWQQIRYGKNNKGLRVMEVPLNFENNLYSNEGGSVIDLNGTSRLLIHERSNDKFDFYILSAIPKMSFRKSPESNKFSGVFEIYSFSDDTNFTQFYSDGFPIRSKKDSRENNYNCVITDWYSCASGDGGETWYCQFMYTDESCESGDSSEENYFYSSGGGGGGGFSPGDGTSSPDPEIGEEIVILEADRWEKEKICTSPEFSQSPCLKDVWNKISLTDAGYNVIKKFLGENPVAHLCLGVDSLSSNTVNGYTFVSGSMIMINFNSNNLNRSQLSIARTFFHELIHAEMYRKVKSVNNLIDPNDFPGIYDYIRRHNFNWQHEQMAQHYIGSIADYLEVFDGYNLSREQYEAIAWIGLRKIEDKNNPNPDGTYNLIDSAAWKSISLEKRERIKKLISDFVKTENKECK